MGPSFDERIPSLPEEELRRIAGSPLGYRREIVEAAAAELARRGQALPVDEAARLRALLDRREAEEGASLVRDLVGALGPSLPVRLARLRALAAAIAAAGICAGAAIWSRAAPEGDNPLGFRPEETKKYVREVELFGGKLAVQVAQLGRWWDGLWRGPRLGVTVAVLSVAAAALLWLVGGRSARAADADERRRSAGGSGTG